MKVSTPIILFLSMVCANIFGQSSQAKFYAQTEPSSVQVGESFNLKFILKTVTNSEVAIPDLNDFSIISGPNKSVSVQSINGNWNQLTEYSYVLMPRKSGIFVIGSASVRTSSGVLKTEPIKIEVRDVPNTNLSSKSKNFTSPDSNKDIFIQVLPSKSSAYIGEQFYVDFVLYTRLSVQDFQVSEDPGFSHAYAQELKFYNEGQSQQTVNGKAYIRKLIKRFVVFPQETGNVDIQPMVLQVNVIQDNNDPFSGFFGHDVSTESISSRTQQIKTLSLPADQPKNYIGAVGNYTMDMSVANMSISINDALSVVITVRGDGDVKRIQMPEISFSSDFEMHEPKVIEESSSENNGQLLSKKVFEFLLLPKKEGHFNLKTDLSWFDPITKNFKTKAFTPVSIAVNHSIVQKTKDDDSDNDSGFRFVSLFKKFLVWFSGIFIGIVLIALLFLFRKRKKNKLSPSKKTMLQTTPTETKIEKKIDPLVGLQACINTSDQQKFYATLQSNLRKYLGQTYSIADKELNNANIFAQLESIGLDSDSIDKIKNMFSTSEQVLYAGADKSALMYFMLNQTKELTDSIKG